MPNPPPAKPPNRPERRRLLREAQRLAKEAAKPIALAAETKLQSQPQSPSARWREFIGASAFTFSVGLVAGVVRSPMYKLLFAVAYVLILRSVYKHLVSGLFGWKRLGSCLAGFVVVSSAMYYALVAGTPWPMERAPAITLQMHSNGQTYHVSGERFAGIDWHQSDTQTQLAIFNRSPYLMENLTMNVWADAMIRSAGLIGDIAGCKFDPSDDAENGILDAALIDKKGKVVASLGKPISNTYRVHCERIDASPVSLLFATVGKVSNFKAHGHYEVVDGSNRVVKNFNIAQATGVIK